MYVQKGETTPPSSSPSSAVSMEASPLISRPSSIHSYEPSPEQRRRIKRFALLAACLIPFGAHYVKQSLAPLRPLFTKAGTSSYMFGLLLSASAWPNLFQPFLAGLFIDSKGHEHGAIVFTALALFGHAIFASSITKVGVDQSTMIQAMVGRIIFGLGSGGSGVVQGAIIGHHFDDDVTLAVGLTESVHYLAKWLGKATPVPVAVTFNGSFAVSIWLGCLFCLFSCLLAVGYVLQEEIRKPFQFALNPRGNMNGKVKRHPSTETLGSRSSEIVDDESYFKASWGLLRSLPLAFWAIASLHLLFSNISGLFAGFSTDYLVETFSLTPETAAYYASVDAFLPIFVSPIVGRLIDKVGGRLTVCMVAALVCCISFMLLLNVGSEIPYGPLIPMLLISVSSCTTPTLIKSCVPLVAPREALGTAFSIYSVFESLGTSIGHVSLGYLRDITRSYDLDLQVLLAISFAALVMTFVVQRYDNSKLRGLLDAKKSETDLII